MFKSLINDKFLLITLLCLLVMLPVAAQDDGSHVLTLGQPVSNTIDESNAAQIYTFTANAGDVVTPSGSGSMTRAPISPTGGKSN